jgi:BirA family biotin operon repressor/biotin-[acetyl-CoA-carboxylase] ligase
MFHRILQVLADGQPHTVQELTSKLAVSPRKLDHLIKILITYGVEFSSLNAPNYQLSENLELLEHASLWAKLPKYIQQQIAQLEIIDVIDSTNHYVLTQAQHPLPLICLAEYQTAGRGRHGRQWISPYASGLCLSIKQHYTRLNYSLGGLGIALAITVARLLRAIGAGEIGVKWPNDIIWRNRKLAGLLLETRKRNQLDEIVVGIGINVKMPGNQITTIEQPWVDLRTVIGQPISRNTLAALLIEHCLQTLMSYSQDGLTTFLSDWYHFDLLYGQLVTLENSTFNGDSTTAKTLRRTVTGRASGIDEQGALLLQTDEGKQRYFYGEARIRV